MDARIATLPAGDPKRASLESDRQRVQNELDGLVSGSGGQVNATTPDYWTRQANVASGQTPSEMPDLRKMALDALPAVGSMAGGMIGGAGGTIGGLAVGGVPGAVGGAAAGGAGGEAVRQLLARGLGMDAPQTPQDAAASIAAEGAVGGALEGAGALARGGVRAVGRSLLGDALRPSATAAKPGIVRGARSAVDIMERERIPAGRAPWEAESGFRKADAAVGRSVAEAEKMLGGSPTKFTVRDVVNEASADLRKIKLRAANARQMEEVNQFVREAAQFGDSPGPRGGTVPRRLSLNELNDRKRTWQNMASGAYRTTERTGSSQSQSATLSSFQQDAAKALAAAANRLMKREVPEVGAQNQLSAELGTLRRALLEAEARPSTWNPLAHGNAVTNASFALSNPAVTSRLGLLGTHPALLRILQYGMPAGQAFIPMPSLDRPE